MYKIPQGWRMLLKYRLLGDKAMLIIVSMGGKGKQPLQGPSCPVMSPDWFLIRSV